jgi:hypothetical protein
MRWARARGAHQIDKRPCSSLGHCADAGRRGGRERGQRAGWRADSTLNPAGSGPQHSVREVLHDGRDGGPGMDA